MNNLKYVILGGFLLLIQLLISGYINIWPMLYIAVFPLLVITLPYTCNHIVSILTAFCFGLLVDILSDGVLGLNAAAIVAIAYFRPLLFKVAVSKTTLENTIEITQRTIGITQFLLVTALSYAIFFTIYIALDSWGYFSFIYTIARFLLNIIINTAVALLLWKSINSQIFR